MDTAATGPFQVRPAAIADTDAIVDVWFNGWREAHLGHVPDALLAHRSQATFRERIPEILATTSVVTIDHRVVGLVVTATDEIEQLYVAPSHRGTGIAVALLRHGETVIADEHRSAFLAVVDGNARARRFYERHGWQDTGPFAYHAWTSNDEQVTVPCRRYEKRLGTVVRQTSFGRSRTSSG
jgi:GNAT superfamily N-acetyltransferase